jgi:hypothetical protein
VNNRRLIDLFKQAHGLQFDQDMASIFHLSKQQLSDWVNDRRPIPTPVKFRLLHLIDYPQKRLPNSRQHAGRHSPYRPRDPLIPEFDNC